KDASSHVAHRRTHTHRFPAKRTGIAHDATHGLHHQVKRRTIFKWPGVAVARHGTGNNTWVHLLQRLIIDAQALQDTGAEVVVNNVRAPHQLVEDLEAGGALQIQRHALLAPVHAQEITALAVHEMRWHLPAPVALAGDFDLQYLGPQVTQNHTAVGPG